MVSKKNISKVNILEHVLVPSHKVLSSEEREALLRKYNIKPSQLPKMLVSDPVAVAIRGKAGVRFGVSGVRPGCGVGFG